MKLETTMPGTSGECASGRGTRKPNSVQAQDLRRVSRLRPAKLSSNRDGLGKRRRARPSPDDESSSAVVVFPEPDEKHVAPEADVAQPSAANSARGDNLHL